ncbi:alpha/beta-hydrolase [Phlegmacium glaucopus]|nr:alpha/beta-hydrolase [Phlegmacium glaucopus]
MKLRNYGDISWRDYVHLATIVLRAPFIILWSFAINLVFLCSIRAAKRATVISTLRFFNSTCNAAQLQYALGKSENTYKAWAKQNNLPITIEELVNDTVLYWIGPKRTDRVVLYIPGGAYVAPVADFSLSFWRHIQLELAKNTCEVGFAVLSYSLIPGAVFPTQIRQASLALEHIIASGVHPSNLHIVADSAGAHLLLATLSHLIHPLGTIRKTIPLQAPIRGIYLMSPWVCLKSTSSSFQSNSGTDIINGPKITIIANLVLADVPKHHLAYAEPADAPDSWFTGLDSVVDRILMTAGGAEMLRDDIVRFSQTLNRTTSDFTFVVQDEGVHDGPLIDHLSGQPIDDPRSLTPEIIRWLRAGIMYDWITSS